MPLINIVLNGKLLQVADGLSLAQILAQQGYDPELMPYFAVAVNQEFMPKQRHAQLRIIENDCIDIVTPMQGG